MRNLIILILFSLTSAAYGQRVQKAVFYFDYAKADLTPSSKKALTALLAQVRGAEVNEIVISGHTDTDGSNEYNQKLSQARAELIYRYFTTVLMDTTKIQISYFGESKPIVTNVGERHKQQNRRVEVIVRYTSYQAATQTTTAAQGLLTKQSDKRTPAIRVTKELVQSFTASPTKEIAIQGKAGTFVRFDANSFVTRKGMPVTTDVTVELVEIYSKSDMIANNIPTVSDQKLLETGGMIYLRITAKGEEVALKEDALYRIVFPAPDKKQDMSVFYGEAIRRTLNWKQAPSNRLSDYTYVDNRKSLSRYIFDASTLGWINCDRFINRKPITNLTVTSSDTTNVNFCLVFKSINSVMNVSDRRAGISFRNVPVGETAAVVAFKKTAKGIYYSSQKVLIQDNQTVAMKLEKLTEEEFKARLQQFN